MELALASAADCTGIVRVSPAGMEGPEKGAIPLNPAAPPPGGYTMSVAMTNCGRVGWVSDRAGYRHDPVDPDTGAPWPAIPQVFLDLAVRAADKAGFASYDPDA